jgi:hypothetical protein
MRQICGALFLSVAMSWSAAAPASIAQSPRPAQDTDQEPGTGLFEFSNEFDLDVLAVLADGEGVRPGPHADFRLRSTAEAVAQNGIRWGGALAIGARTRDGRRALRPRSSTPLGQPGLVTGLGGPGLIAEAGVGLTRAEGFVKTTRFEVFAGLGPTAARRGRLVTASALRLTGADGALNDPLGSGRVDTGLSLSRPAPQITVQSRRLAGFAAAASFTPQGDACGLEACLDSAYGTIDQIASVSVSFDRRNPASRVRWRVHAGVETGQAQPGPVSGPLEDPWLASAQLAREAGGVTLAANALITSDGLPGVQYQAFSTVVTLEEGDWLIDAQLGWADSDRNDRAGWTAQLGASRFVGRRGVAGVGIQLQDEGGAALLAETGLRF